MTRALTSDWVRLWRLAERLAPAAEGAAGVFEPIGLILADPAEPFTASSDATPAGSVMFAGTGGDGVHFSALGTDGAGAVVMTVPMAFDSPNHVLGKDIPEFLALGCRTGYFHLERLAYGWGRQDTVVRLESGLEADDPDEAGLLQHIVDEFNLQPWPEVDNRLRRLAGEHGNLLG
ncbi:hypothetical protein [Plantactinospora soyae]|uniref:Uncharacterized protein n=1 Tax=Plantactinospora soyae TaxID=1544732 RepID=A0A927MFG9_9ACTN|nr:hypothetical protein [Plantactinospora soyae]MBE1492725.1 hypothetical protein [Plantactinospora soyae]